LYEIDRLPLLGVFSLVCVPEAVWDESVAGGHVPAHELEMAARLQRHQITPGQVAQTAALSEATGLHQGEIECLALCRALTCPLLLTDDLAARNAAKLIGIRPVGSLGVIVRAYYQGRVSLREAEDAIEKLYSISTLFVTRAIADLAIEQLRRPHP
jgi:predicted nucleic acid-binding protein